MEKSALFYPRISLTDAAWIKAMALFYENIYRIVPDDVSPDDAAELQPLLEDGRIGKKISPTRYSQQASEEFLSKLGDWNAAALTYEEDEEEPLTRLHTGKIDERVRELFQEAGFQEENDWMHVPTNLASNFMLYLANHIATKNQLALITNDWGAWTGTSYFSVDGKVDDYATRVSAKADLPEDSFGLFGLVLSELVPLNIAEIPSKKIVQFREQRQDEIRNFHKCIDDLRDELTLIDSEEIKIDVIRSNIQDLIRAQEQYKRSADIINAKGWFGIALQGFPSSIKLLELCQIPIESAIALGLGGLVIGGIVSVENSKEELRKLRQQNPASLLMDLKRSFKNYTHARGGGDINYHAWNCMEEYVND